MATHTGIWMNPDTPITQGASRLHVVDEQSGQKIAIVDFNGIDPVLAVDDVVSTDVGRHFKVLTSASLGIGCAVRCLGVPTSAP